MSRSSVDLPQPDGPTRTMNSPSAISRSRPRMASKPFGKTLRMPCRVTDAIAPAAYWPDTIEAKPRSSCFWMPAKIATTGAVPMSAMNISRCQSMSHLPMFMKTPTVIG